MIFHPKKGILKHKGNKYKAFGNKIVDTFTDLQGGEHEADGTETPIEDILNAHLENKHRMDEAEQKEFEKLAKDLNRLEKEVEEDASRKTIISSIESLKEEIIGLKNK